MTRHKINKSAIALSTARKYAKKAEGGALDEGYLVTPGTATAPTRITPRLPVLPSRSASTWTPLTRQELPALPEAPPEEEKPTRYFPEPTLSELQMYEARGYKDWLPDDVDIVPGTDNAFEMYNKQTGDPVYFSKRSNILPLAVDKEGGVEMAMPGLLDPLSNTIGGIVPKGGKVLGAGLVLQKGEKAVGLTQNQLIDFGEALAEPMSGKAGANLAKSLKQPYPKDLAVEAIKQGLEADELSNLTSYLSDGAQKAFWKWHKKLTDQAMGLQPKPVMAPLEKQVNEVLTPPAPKLKLPQTDFVKLATESLNWPEGKVNMEMSKMSQVDAELFQLIREQLKESTGAPVQKQIIEPTAPEITSKAGDGVKLPTKPEGYGANFGDYIASPVMMEKIGAQKGSNPGGIFKDNKGNKFYIKEGLSKDHVRNELTAASLYDLAGVPTFKYRPVFGDKHIATEWKSLDANNLDQLSNKEIAEARKDFAVHAWLGNYDAIGTGGDNIGIMNGKPAVLDTGGSMDYRAQGKPKTNFGTSVEEIDSMRDPSINEWSAKVYGGMSEDDIRESVKKVAAIPDKAIEKAIKSHGGSDALIQKMLGRKYDLMDRFNVGDPPAPKVKDPFEQIPLTQQELDDWKPNRAFEPEGPEGWGADKNYMSFSNDDVADFISKDDKLPDALISALYDKYGKPSPWGVSNVTIPLNKIEPTVTGTKQSPSDIIHAVMMKGTGDTDISVFGHQGKNITKALDKIPSEAISFTLNAYKATPQKINNLFSWMSTDKKAEFLHHLAPKLEQYGYKVDIDPPKPGSLTPLKKAQMEEIQSYFQPVDWQKWEPPPDSAGVQKHTTPNFGPQGFKKHPLGEAKKKEVEKLGFNTRLGLFHGGKGSWAEELVDPKLKDQTGATYDSERAFFLSDNPDISKTYGDTNLSDPFVARGGKDDVYEVNWPKLKGYNSYDETTMRALIDAGHDKGAKMLIVRGISDLGGIQTQYLVLDTAVLRKTSAKFDPEKLHLAKPLAGLAGGGTFVYGLAPNRAEAAPKKYRGGSVLEKAVKASQKYAKGGALKTEGLGDPSNHRSFNSGMLDADIPGRTDKLPIKVRSGSYVIPADIPSASALGEGNTMAGKKTLDHLFTPHKIRGMRLKPQKSMATKSLFKARKAEGGEVEGEIPIIAAGGEYVVDPETVASIGDGDLDKGHSELDKFVKKIRRHNVETLRKLPGPKKN